MYTVDRMLYPDRWQIYIIVSIGAYSAVTLSIQVLPGMLFKRQQLLSNTEMKQYQTANIK